MSPRWIAVAILLAGFGIIAYSTWQRIKHPARVLGKSFVEIADPARRDDIRIRLPTRVVAAGGITLTEVELPNGTWIDCSGDCATAARTATSDFWDERQRRGR